MRLLSVLIFSIFISPTLAIADLVLIDENIRVQALDGPNNNIANEIAQTIPFAGGAFAGAGASSAFVSLNFSQAGSTVDLNYNFNLNRTGLAGRAIVNNFNSMKITPSVDMTYEASGSMAVTDGGDGFGEVDFNASLSTFGGGDVFTSSQQSQFTTNESFEIGGSGGDSFNYFTGSLTGTLQAGVTYIWFVQSDINSLAASPTGATATGNWNLKLTAVPEPTSLILFAAFTTPLAFNRRRR